MSSLCDSSSVGGKLPICLSSDIATHCALGIRVSLYNAVTEEETDKLVSYMKEFIAQEAS